VLESEVLAWGADATTTKAKDTAAAAQELILIQIVSSYS
jgi:hypothetical protein